MSDSDSEDNDIRYGTPLEPYEEDEVPSKRKYQEPTDQYAVDAHGRRRFHGAFTGGFSAGFGNTVGSQEGWTPQTFKSSRMEKAALSSQRPEDFMDEEDRSEFGIAPRLMQTSHEFSGQKRPRPRAFHDGPIPGEPVLEQLLRPVHETCAVRMLRAMGWRAGQGAGARLRGEEKRKAQAQHRVYGCYMPPEMRPKEPSDEDGSDSEVDYDTLFAPDDYEPYILRQKNDRFGLGYQGLSRHSVLGNLVGEYGSGDSRSRLVMKDKGKKVSIRGQAFGVGAFEADDEDIYATEDMSHYDFTLAPARDKPSLPDKNEGPNVLQGFCRSSKPLPSVPAYPPPALPRDYTPLPAGARRSRFEPSQAPQRDQGLGRHELTAEARGQLLGETPTKQTDTQNTQTQSNTKKDELAHIMGRSVDFVSTDKTEIIDLSKSEAPKIIDMTAKKDTPDFISIKDSGKELVNTFKPFKTNPKKQARYEEYCATGGVDRDGDMDRLNEWEREREMVEFEQAAKLYRPLTGIMGDRFTHASIPDDAVNPLTAVARSGGGHTAASAEQREAASSGMYGALTRTQLAWRPDSVVCKRFNVPEPNVTRLEPKKDERPKVSYSVFSYMESSVHDKSSFTKEQGKFSGSKSQRDHVDIRNDQKLPLDQNHQISDQNRQSSDQSLQNADLISSDQTSQVKNDQTPVQVQKISEQNNPFKRMTVAELFIKESESTKEQGKEVTETIDKFDKMDLYKSIFLSDSEDEAEDSKANETPIKIIETIDFVDVPKNIVRNTSPPRGIFANINFDELNSWKRTEKQKEDKPKESETVPIEVAYGPKIPENLKNRLESGQNDTSSNDNKVDVVIGSSSDDSWVDVKEVKAKKSKKKKKHKAKDKKKSKHKKKDR